MSVALLLLRPDFFITFRCLAPQRFVGFHCAAELLAVHVDLRLAVFEILLGFGTVMVLMESVRREVELANQNLMEARDKLELLVQMDPLTEALNRHAFHSLLRKPERWRGGEDFGQRCGDRYRQPQTDQRHVWSHSR
jgi:hypothetical protein